MSTTMGRTAGAARGPSISGESRASRPSTPLFRGGKAQKLRRRKQTIASAPSTLSCDDGDSNGGGGPAECDIPHRRSRRGPMSPPGGRASADGDTVASETAPPSSLDCVSVTEAEAAAAAEATTRAIPGADERGRSKSPMTATRSRQLRRSVASIGGPKRRQRRPRARAARGPRRLLLLCGAALLLSSSSSTSRRRSAALFASANNASLDGGRETNEDYNYDNGTALARTVGRFKIKLFETPAGRISNSAALELANATATFGMRRLEEKYAGTQYELEGVDMVVVQRGMIIGIRRKLEERGAWAAMARRPLEAMVAGGGRSRSASAEAAERKRGEREGRADRRGHDDAGLNGSNGDIKGVDVDAVDLELLGESRLRAQRRHRLRRTQNDPLIGTALLLEGTVRYARLPVPQDWALLDDFRNIMQELNVSDLLEFFPGMADDPDLSAVKQVLTEVVAVTVKPTSSPTAEPTSSPTAGPTGSPTTPAPTVPPTPAPTSAPNPWPTTVGPTPNPTTTPTEEPAGALTIATPTPTPTLAPTLAPQGSTGQTPAVAENTTPAPTSGTAPSNDDPTKEPTTEPTIFPNHENHDDTPSDGKGIGAIVQQEVLGGGGSSEVTVIIASSMVGAAVAGVLSLLFVRRRRRGGGKGAIGRKGRGFGLFYADLGGPSSDSDEDFGSDGPMHKGGAGKGAPGTVYSGSSATTVRGQCGAAEEALDDPVESGFISGMGQAETSANSVATPRIRGSAQNPFAASPPASDTMPASGHNPFGPSPVAETPMSGYGSGRDGLQFDPEIAAAGAAATASILGMYPSLYSSSTASGSTTPASAASAIHRAIEAGSAGRSDAFVQEESPLSSRPSTASTTSTEITSPSEVPLGVVPKGGIPPDEGGQPLRTPDSAARALETSAVAASLFNGGSIPRHQPAGKQQLRLEQASVAAAAAGGRNLLPARPPDDDITPLSDGRGPSVAEMNCVGSAPFDRAGERIPEAWSSARKQPQQQGAKAIEGDGRRNSAGGGAMARKFNFDDVSSVDDGEGEDDENTQGETPMKANGRRGSAGQIEGRSVSQEFHENDWGHDLPYDWDPVRDNPNGKVKEGGVVSTPDGRRRERMQKRRSGRSLKTEDSWTSVSRASGGDDAASPRLSPGDGAFPVSSPEYNSSPTEQNEDFDSARSHGTNGDGDSTTYRTCRGSALHPLDWSNKASDTEIDEISVGQSTLSETASGEHLGKPGRDERRIIWSHQLSPGRWDPKRSGRNGGGGGRGNGGRGDGRGGLNGSPLLSPETTYGQMQSPHTTCHTTNTGSIMSGASNMSGTTTSSKQLINDLVWLEKKIADVKSKASRGDSPTEGSTPRNIADCSISYGSDLLSPSSEDSSSLNDAGSAILQSIVCRDCFAPPGKLQIVIVSTKDGPSVHTVKQGSALEGHLFLGDLIVAVDDVDTRTFSAEQVMKMLTSKADFERKITVLHFEDRC